VPPNSASSLEYREYSSQKLGIQMAIYLNFKLDEEYFGELGVFAE